MDEKQRKKLREIKSINERIEFLISEQIEITPEVIDLLGSDRYSLHGSFILPQVVYQLINQFAINLSIKSMLDPFCGSGDLIYHLSDSIQKKGVERNVETSRLAQLLNPKASIEAREVVNNPLEEKYQFVATTLVPFSSDFKQVDRTVDTLLSLLREGGHLVFVAPSSLLSSVANQKTREKILNKYSLEAIVELSRTSLQIAVDLSMIVIRNAPQTQSVYLGKLVPGNSEDVLRDFREHVGEYWVDVSQLGIRWDRDFHDPEYLALENELNQKEAKPLGELAEIVAGVHVDSSDRRSHGQYLVLTPGNIQNSHLISREMDYYTDGIDNPRFESAVLKEGDILVSVLGPKFKTYIFNKNDPFAVANQNFAIIRGAQFAKYVEIFLRSDTGYEQFLKQIKRRIRGSVIPRINIIDLRSVLVPCMPIDDLNKAIESRYGVFSEDAIATILTKKLEEKGWEVQKEYTIQSDKRIMRLDLALFNQGTLEGIVEIKQYTSLECDIVSIRDQLDRYLHATAALRAFAFFDGEFYEYRNGELLLLKHFPSPLSPVELKIKPATMLSEMLATIPEDYVLKYFLEIKKDQEEIKKDIEVIKKTTAKTEEKVSEILSVVRDLNEAFRSVKSMPIDLEEKIILLNQELDQKISTLQTENQDQFDMYEDIVHRWLGFDWDKLDTLSKQLLPSAEYLFTQLTRFPDTDLSPFIIQYCRALENEILKKIFRAYLQSLIDREIDIKKDFSWDFGKKESDRPNNENTLKLAEYIRGCLLKDRSTWFFELGTMETYLRYLTGKTVRKSPLLQDLKDFIFYYFEKNVIEVNFLNELKRITTQYRNRAAHTDIIMIEEAKEGKREIRNIIIQFLENYK